MDRYTYAGLPTTPALYWSSEQGKAVVVGKVRSVQSVLWSQSLWQAYLALLMPFWVGGVIASLAQQNPLIALVAAVVLFIGGGALGNYVIFPFFNLYGNRSIRKVIFTPDSVKVGRRSYSRNEGGLPLTVLCTAGRDESAERRVACNKYDRSQEHLFMQSRRIALVIRMPSDPFGCGHNMGPGRVCELLTVIGEQEAYDFVAVCQAALQLTAAASPTPPPTQPPLSDLDI